MLRKACISIAAAAMVITGSVSAANAIQVDAGGGRWDYGTGWTNVWSNYYHRGLWHGSSGLAITTLTVDAQHLIVGPMHRHKSHGITQDDPTTVTASFLLWLMRV